jgi:hypothetical protein
MFVRAVRFTGVTQQQIDALRERIEQSGGPPEGVTTTGIEIGFDSTQGTAIVLQRFETAADMETAARIFGAMDAGETPGTRVSVDSCEVVLELNG